MTRWMTGHLAATRPRLAMIYDQSEHFLGHQWASAIELSKYNDTFWLVLSLETLLEMCCNARLTPKRRCLAHRLTTQGR